MPEFDCARIELDARDTIRPAIGGLRIVSAGAILIGDLSRFFLKLEPVFS
jgi:hypothetical protein